MTPTTLLALAQRCEAAEGPDRSLDWDIHLRDGLWGVGSYGNHPHYTGSLDSALTLLPEGWFWRAVKTSYYQAWAVVQRYHPDHCVEGKDEFFANRKYHEPKWTPALALTAACLRARAAGMAEK